jgi:fatty acid desaturase
MRIRALIPPARDAVALPPHSLSTLPTGLSPPHATRSRQLALVRDLLDPNPLVYWFDLAVTGVLAWGALAAALLVPPWSTVMFGACALAALAFYRALCFIHEIVHLRPGCLPGFARTWNVVVGLPFLFPLFLYDGVHRDHHAAAIYGSARDPEYLALAGNRAGIIVLLAGSAVLPLLLLLRFLPLSAAALALPSLHRWLERHASALAMNRGYVRTVDAAMHQRIVRGEIAILGLWSGALGLAAAGLLPWRAFALWYAIAASIVLLNNLRALGAHAYRSNGSAMSREAQVADSIDTPGGWWSELWAPLGLRFHSLHHLFPTIPYHNLARAHRRLTASGAPASITVSRSLPHSLAALWSAPAPPEAWTGAAPLTASGQRFPPPRSGRPAGR